MMIARILIAKGEASGAEFIIGLVFLLVVVLVSVAVGASAKYDVVIRNGLPYCPRCNRQVTYRRGECRSCGYQFKTYGGGAQISQPRPIATAFVPTAAAPVPISSFERLHRNSADVDSLARIFIEIQNTLRERLMGAKTVECDANLCAVILRRARLQYEAHIYVGVTEDRHGFEVSVPSHGFKIRITCPRFVPEGVIDAPWDDLLENLCKVDRSIIKGRKSKSHPLSYVPRHGPHPGLRVEVLSRGTREDGPAGLPGLSGDESPG
jgi:hypothetical protein